MTSANQWLEPIVIDYSSSNVLSSDFGYLTAIRSLVTKREVMFAYYGTRESSVPAGQPKNCGIYLIYDTVPTRQTTVHHFRDVNSENTKSYSLYKGDGTNTVVYRIQDGAINLLNGLAVTITAGGGSPEGVVTANPGSIYLRRSGAAGTSFYVKETGTGNTGWVAK